MKYRDYITYDGDRWDLIAYRFYKNPLGYEIILNANPHVKPLPVLSSGIKLKIPVVKVSRLLGGDDIPPWKR